MPKGMISQSAVLLTTESISTTQLKEVLGKNNFTVVKETPPGEAWQFGGASLLIAYRPDINGYVSIDVVNQLWPDSMGNPKTDFTTFGAWTTGWFGPWAYPMGLQRARDHSWAWPKANEVVNRHNGFVRIRLSYAFGASKDAPVLPGNYDPLDEMNFVGQIALALLDMPGVLCYFNPNGEVLRDHSAYSRVWNECKEGRYLPLSLWSNIRLFNLNDSLTFMDTVGNAQLDIMDIEAIFPSSRYSPGDVDYYLRNVTQYLIDATPDFRTGQSIDGPNETGLSWTIEVIDDGLVAPLRKVLRLYPKTIQREVLEIVSRKVH
ncbi:MAG TPA: DUF4261 domain-containing protein [Steroidobacteraceae bacterium]|nr:DUF4261 domain-containing protein [Steroidobacteraceae bacterium]